jgi:hypothetical protein
VVHAIELGQVSERERLDPVPVYQLGNAESPRSFLKPVHGARRDFLET